MYEFKQISWRKASLSLQRIADRCDTLKYTAKRSVQKHQKKPGIPRISNKVRFQSSQDLDLGRTNNWVNVSAGPAVGAGWPINWGLLDHIKAIPTPIFLKNIRLRW